jgi:hypothetical protein
LCHSTWRKRMTPAPVSKKISVHEPSKGASG